MLSLPEKACRVMRERVCDVTEREKSIGFLKDSGCVDQVFVFVVKHVREEYIVKRKQTCIF